MKRLVGKVAVITGGATGIGEAISKLFAREGAQVVVNGYEDDPVDDVVRAIRGEGGEAAPYIGDVSLERHAKQLVETAVNAFGKIDILVNNAGVFPAMAEIQEYPYDAFEPLLKNNIRTAFTVTKLPGSNTPSGLSTRARNCTAPVAGSTTSPEKSSVP